MYVIKLYSPNNFLFFCTENERFVIFFQKKCKKNLVKPIFCSTFVPGEVAEWSIAAVLKTVELRGSGGSNPSLSAVKGVNQVVTRFTPFFTPKN